MTVRPKAVRAAAIQMEAEIGNLDANLSMCQRLAAEAATAGADWIVLPEFFSSGAANRPELRDNAPGPDGEPTALLRSLARRHGAHVGGSTLVRDADGHVRNAFLLAGPDGDILGRHDKDLPTMWENALYIGGGDTGRIVASGLTVGVAMCWELLRTQTLHRLGGQVDVVLAGSGWWSVPAWPPHRLWNWQEARNHRLAITAPRVFGKAVGAPLIHAAHAGRFNCPWPLAGTVYHGRYQGGAMVCDADGNLLAFRDRDDGPGFAIADLPLVRRQPAEAPQRFWLQRRSVLGAACWAYQNVVGRHQYRRAFERRQLLRATEAVAQ